MKKITIVNSAICMDCFSNGNHEGHDYKIHKSSGGVCDCGDPQGIY